MATVKEPCRYCGKKGLVWYKSRYGEWFPAHPNPDGSPNPRRIHRYECKKAPGAQGTKSFKS